MRFFKERSNTKFLRRTTRLEPSNDEATEYEGDYDLCYWSKQIHFQYSFLIDSCTRRENRAECRC